MDPAITFYQTLAGLSFTLLGLWFTVLQLGHGGWRTDPRRHRAGLHIALHFCLPGAASMASVLASGAAGGLVWRTTFVLAGLLGTAEAVSFLRRPKPAVGRSSRVLWALDPVLYAAMVVVAFTPRGASALTPLQLAGTVTGALFLTGLCSIWVALAEPPDVATSPRKEPSAALATAVDHGSEAVQPAPPRSRSDTTAGDR
jgi:hypothetical protein